MSFIITLVLLFVPIGFAFGQGQVGARIQPVWAPILTEELRESNQPQAQHIFFDPKLSQYVARYIPVSKQSEGNAQHVIVPITMPNQGKPKIRSGFEAAEGVIQYNWSVSNESEATAAVRAVAFTLPKSDAGLKCKHPLNRPVIIQAGGPSAAVPLRDGAPELKLSLGDFRFATFPLSVGSHIAPGASLAGLSCNSAYLPGWTSVYLPAGEDGGLDADTPPEVSEELGRVLPLQKYWTPGVALGPRYPASAPKEIIAMDYLTGLSVYESFGLLDGKSKFVESVKNQLNQIVSNKAAVIAVALAATTEDEREFGLGLKLSLPEYFRE